MKFRDEGERSRKQQADIANRLRQAEVDRQHRLFHNNRLAKEQENATSSLQSKKPNLLSPRASNFRVSTPRKGKGGK
jgi:hypothetical protein